MSQSQVQINNDAGIEINGTTGGYTCGMCGAWVPYGTIHICNQGRNEPWNPCLSCQIYQKIDMLLEKLTKLIEVLEKK